MPGTSLLTLIDDISSALDDVALMTKVAAQKTGAVLGDDLALNAQQIIGIHANRELPVVWAVAKGSFINKLILVPLALLISFFAPYLVTILLMLGGLYLCFEGYEKLIEKFLPHEVVHPEQTMNVQTGDLHQFEQDKVRGAVRTDFVLSAEIIVITLGTVASNSLTQQLIVLTLISLIMTVGVYGLVACIVKLDDLGLILREKKRPLKQMGLFLIGVAPILMKLLAVVGTIAMFLVGGGIIAHGLPFFHHYIDNASAIISLGINFFMGLVAGAMTACLIFIFHKIKAQVYGFQKSK